MFNFSEEFKLNDIQREQFEKYFNFLIEENCKINLTAIIEKDEVYIKHFYDSLLINQVIDINNVKNICDIGSGAGFPSIPLKIVYPHLEITIIEPIQKRTNFLKKLVQVLNLDDINIINGRAEDEIINYRESFDIVTARAVAKMDILSELCIPYVKVGGYFLAMKGKNFEEELNDAKRAIKILGGKLEQSEVFTLPKEMGSRGLIKIIKVKPTKNQYPRHFSKIKKNPL